MPAEGFNTQPSALSFHTEFSRLLGEPSKGTSDFSNEAEGKHNFSC